MASLGVSPSFVGTGEADPKKIEQVKALLRRAVPANQIESYLSGTVPHMVEFRNHKSYYDNLPFARQEVAKLEVNGASHRYAKGERKPKVVNPLGVANLPKGRLVLNGKYPNSFCKHLPFKYETLRDVLTFLHKNGFIATWDLKAGYFHVLIHPRFRTYLGFNRKGCITTTTQSVLGGRRPASSTPRSCKRLQWRSGQGRHPSRPTWTMDSPPTTRKLNASGRLSA